MLNLRDIACYLLDVKTIIGAISAILLLIFGIRYRNRLTKQRDIRNPTIKEFTEAAGEFKLAFSEDIVFLKIPLHKDNVSLEDKFCMRFDKSFAAQEKAMFKLRAYMPEEKHISFDDAWERYKYGDAYNMPNRDGYGLRNHYIRGSEIETREKALKNINQLLHFTNPGKMFK